MIQILWMIVASAGLAHSSPELSRLEMACAEVAQNQEALNRIERELAGLKNQQTPLQTRPWKNRRQIRILSEAQATLEAEKQVLKKMAPELKKNAEKIATS